MTQGVKVDISMRRWVFRTIFATGLAVLGAAGISSSVSAFTTTVSSEIEGSPSIVYGGTPIGAKLSVGVKDGGKTPNTTKVQYAWFLIRDGISLDAPILAHNADGWWTGGYHSLEDILKENWNFYRNRSPNSNDGYKYAKFGLCEYFWEFTGGAVTDGYGTYLSQWVTRGGNSVLAECHQEEMRDKSELPLGTAAVDSGRTLEKSPTITVPDVKAGYKICVAAGINYNDSVTVDANYYRWHISGASCATIAKRPNFQAWNGGIYAPNGIRTSKSQKTANAGNSATGEMPGRLFGSWGEYYVVSGGNVTGFASGAGIGYGANMSTIGAYGINQDYCQSSARLTISNIGCETGTTDGYGGENINISAYIDELKASYATDAAGVEYHEGDVHLGQISNVSGTRVIRAGGTVYIDGDICVFGVPSETGCVSSGKYENYLGLEPDTNIEYDSAVQIPQVLIMAKNIIIGQDVTQVDAWLITEDGGTVSTCNDGDVVGTSAECWKTLKVNGPVYTSKLRLKRTGGAWPGLYGDIGNPAEPARLYYGGGAREKDKVGRDLTCDGSVSPAEIFDLHPAVMLWAFYRESTLSRAYITSLQEFAPRF